jgi:hypothetical protein
VTNGEKRLAVHPFLLALRLAVEQVTIHSPVICSPVLREFSNFFDLYRGILPP